MHSANGNKTVPPAVAGHAKARVLLLEEGYATLVDRGQLSSASGLGQTSVDQLDMEHTKDQYDEALQNTKKEADKEIDIPEKASGEYLAYIRTLGSWPIVFLAAACTAAFAAIDKTASKCFLPLASKRLLTRAARIEILYT